MRGDDVKVELALYATMAWQPLRKSISPVWGWIRWRADTLQYRLRFTLRQLSIHVTEFQNREAHCFGTVLDSNREHQSMR